MNLVKKNETYTRGFSHIKSMGVLIIPLGTDNEKNDGEWVGLISASLEEFYFTIIACARFFTGSSPVLYFLGGREGGGLPRGGRGEFYCCNLNHDTRHNLITWNRLQTNICFFASNSRLALLSVKIIYSKGNIMRHQTHF